MRSVEHFVYSALRAGEFPPLLSLSHKVDEACRLTSVQTLRSLYLSLPKWLPALRRPYTPFTFGIIGLELSRMPAKAGAWHELRAGCHRRVLGQAPQRCPAHSGPQGPSRLRQTSLPRARGTLVVCLAVCHGETARPGRPKRRGVSATRSKRPSSARLYAALLLPPDLDVTGMDRYARILPRFVSLFLPKYSAETLTASRSIRMGPAPRARAYDRL